MAQIARPIADIANGTSSWCRADGSGAITTNLYQYIDDSSPDDSDADAIRDSVGGGELYEFKLGAVTDPLVSTGHVLTFRMRMSAGTIAASNLFLGLKVGTTSIFGPYASKLTGTVTTTAADFSYTLSPAEADAITDYTNIRPNVSSGDAYGQLRITQAYLTVPDAATSTNKLAMLIG